MFTYFNENNFVTTGTSTAVSIAKTAVTTAQAATTIGKLTFNLLAN